MTEISMNSNNWSDAEDNVADLLVLPPHKVVQ